MSIGPEARRRASGRIVVVAGVFATIGLAAVVLGAGPVVEAAGEVERVIGMAVIGCGVVMLVGAASLGLRRGPARRLGIAGGIAAAVLGGVVVVAAALSLERCASVAQALPCSMVLVGTALAGLAIGIGGTASAVVVSRARQEALRRRRGRS